ncbi:MAG TPA: hypothetical protein VFC39_21865 [Acidobacteriaceae bacterium]|nr:hypothetical protein [Acidobacteriaceae bacterium]
MNLADAFAQLEKEPEPKPAKPAATKVREIQPPKSPAASLPSEKLGKRKNPDYEQAHFYLRKATNKAARRKWEDEGNGDLSDLVEELLAGYLGGRVSGWLGK